MEDRIKASILIHALGDTIGFRNGIWEFNYNIQTINTMFVYELLSDFIDLGGINNINLKDWNVSDDTIMHMAIAEALIKSDGSTTDIINLCIKNFITAIPLLEGRYTGLTTHKYIEMLKNGEDYKTFKFDKKAGGSGAAMRTPCIGLYYRKDKTPDRIIDVAIKTSKITHNNPIGYLGGLVAALFTYYAINDIDIKKWGINMMEILESKKFDSYMKTLDGYDDYTSYKHSFIGKWKIYLEDKFDDKNNIKLKIVNIARRSRYYLDNYSYEDKFIGSSGDDSVIIAYDCLLDSGVCFEKLIIYAMLHIGDTDTTGCIAGAFYGALYGFENISKHLFDYIEFKDKLYNIANKI